MGRDESVEDQNGVVSGFVRVHVEYTKNDVGPNRKNGLKELMRKKKGKKTGCVGTIKNYFN